MTNLVFPSLPGLAWGVQRTAVWNSRVQKSVSGKRQAVQYMSYPLYRWTLSFNVLREFGAYDELSTLQGFFNSMAGQVDTFLFADPHDASVTVPQAIGTGNGTNKNFQLIRSYGGYIEPVQSPNTYIVYLDGVAQTAGTHYTINSTGVVVFVAAPGAGVVVSWTGTFRFRCAFTSDTMDFINQDGVDIWKSNKITFESVKL